MNRLINRAPYAPPSFELADVSAPGVGTMSDRVYRFLADKLVSGELAPGDRFSLRGVAEALDISMMPVREAVSRLAAEHALEVAPKRAVAVPLMSAAGFRDITRIRIAIEGAAVAMAAEAAGPAELAEIAACEAAFRAQSRSEDPDLTQSVSLNQAFHFALYRAASSAELLAIIERLWLKVGPIINFDLRSSPERLRFGGAVRFHAAMLEAVRTSNPEEARLALSADIQGAADYILSQGHLPD
jgi:DNA-binding GntR family transcriptional regulator